MHIRTHRDRIVAATLVALFMAGGSYAQFCQAFNFGDFMNPSKWIGGGSKYDEDRYEYGPGPYGPPGIGPYGPLPPYGGGPGYGAPYYGYGIPGYYPGAPRFPSAPAHTATQSTSSPTSKNVKDAEIEALKRRIEQLEAERRISRQTPPPSRDWSAPPTSRGGDWETTTRTGDAAKSSTGWNSSPSELSTDWGSAPVFRPLDRY